MLQDLKRDDEATDSALTVTEYIDGHKVKGGLIRD